MRYASRCAGWRRRCGLPRRPAGAGGRPFRDGKEGSGNRHVRRLCYLPRGAASLRSPRDVGKCVGFAAWDGVASLTARCWEVRGICHARRRRFARRGMWESARDLPRGRRRFARRRMWESARDLPRGRRRFARRRMWESAQDLPRGRRRFARRRMWESAQDLLRGTASLRSPRGVGKCVGFAARAGVASLAAGCWKVRGICRAGRRRFARRGVLESARDLPRGAVARGSAQSEGNYAAAFFPLAEPKAAESNAPHSLRCRGVGRVPSRKIRRSAFKAGESIAGPQGRPLRGPGGEAIRTGRADPPRPITCF